MIHEGFVNHPGLMANDQFPMANGGTRTRRAVSAFPGGPPPPLAMRGWDLVIPRLFAMAFANNPS
jgi:hypothetical protein